MRPGAYAGGGRGSRDHGSYLRGRGRLLRGMRFLLIVVLVVVLIGAGMKLAGQRLPFIDYQVGPFGGTVGGPNIQINPPGYDIPLGQ